MKIGLEPSTQWTSVGNGIGSHVEAEFAQDVTARLVPKLQAAGHTVAVFAGQQDANSDGAHALVAWGAHVAISLHLDSASGTPAALLCYQESRSLPMGLALLHYYCQAMGIHDKGGMIRVPGSNGVAVIRIPEAAGIPAALIEMGDMNRPDGPNWTDPNYREKAAQALAVSIITVFGGATPAPVKKEDDMQSWDYYNVTKATKIDCYRDKCNYYVTTDGAASDLRFKLEGHKPGGGGGTTEGQSVSGLQDHNVQDILKQDRMKDIKGSFKLSVGGASPINISIREVPK